MDGCEDRADAAALPASGQPGRSEAVEVALLDRAGVIVKTNAAWDYFCFENDGDLARAGVGISYLEACAAAGDDPAAMAVAWGDPHGAARRPPRTAFDPGSVRCARLPRVFNTLISSRLDDAGACIGATVTLSRASADRSRAAAWRRPDPSVAAHHRSGRRRPGPLPDPATDR